MERWTSKDNELAVGDDEGKRCVGSGEGKTRWWWTVGRRAAIAGAAITSAPVVIPPLVALSALGFAAAFPFAVYLASLACTDKLMRSLLPIPHQQDSAAALVRDKDGLEAPFEEGKCKEDEGIVEEKLGEEGEGKREECLLALKPQTGIEGIGDRGVAETVEEEKSTVQDTLEGEEIREDRVVDKEEQENEEKEVEGGGASQESVAVLMLLKDGLEVVEEGECKEDEAAVEERLGEEGEGRREECLVAFEPQTGIEGIRDEGVAETVEEEKSAGQETSEGVEIGEERVMDREEKEDGEGGLMHHDSDTQMPDLSEGKVDGEKVENGKGTGEEGRVERRVEAEKLVALWTEEPGTECVVVVEEMKPNQVEEAMVDERNVDEEPGSIEVQQSNLFLITASVVVENGYGRGTMNLVEEKRIEDTTIEEEKEVEEDVGIQEMVVHVSDQGVEASQSILGHNIGNEPQSPSLVDPSSMEDQALDTKGCESSFSIKHDSDMMTGSNAVIAEVKAVVSSNNEEMVEERREYGKGKGKEEEYLWASGASQSEGRLSLSESQTRIEGIRDGGVAKTVEEEKSTVQETSKGEGKEDQVVKEEEEGGGLNSKEVMSSFVAVISLVHDTDLRTSDLSAEKENRERAEEKQQKGMWEEGEVEQRVETEKVADPEAEGPSAEGIMMVEYMRPNEEKVMVDERDVGQERKENSGLAGIKVEHGTEVEPSSLEYGYGVHTIIFEEERLTEETMMGEEKEVEGDLGIKEQPIHVSQRVESSQGTLVAVANAEHDIKIEKHSPSLVDEAADSGSMSSTEHVSDMRTGSKAVAVEVKAMMASDNEVIYREEELWEQIQAMRTIVGYKAALRPTYMEEIRALFLFTGVEPPFSSKESSNQMEASNNLQCLKSLIGVE